PLSDDASQSGMRPTPIILASCLATAMLSCAYGPPPRSPFSAPVLTPDATGIVFAAHRGDRCLLYEADITTGAAHLLTGDKDGCEFSPTFSPDGRQLAYMRRSDRGSYAALMLANADGKSGRVLVPDDADNLKPAFVPHSNRLVFLQSGSFGHA